LKDEFEMKDFRKIRFCLGLQIEHLSNKIFAHQSTYIEKVPKHMNNAHPLSTPMILRSLDAKKHPFQPLEKDEEIRGHEVTYLSATRALMYFTNCTIPYIAFVVNLYARYSSTPTKNTRMSSNIYFDIFMGQLK
jgi:hypothetical protein